MRFFPLLAIAALPACLTPPPAAEPPEVSTAPDRGTVLSAPADTYGAFADFALENVISYASQGDTAAVDQMLADNDAIAIPSGTQVIFEGCYYGESDAECDPWWVRFEGESDRWVVWRDALAVDR